MKNPNTKRLAFIDLDGTLLGPDKTVSPENLAALKRLRDEDVQIIIASGRHHRNIAAFDSIGEMNWILSSQGSVVRNEKTGEILLEMTLSPERVAEIRERAREMGVSVIAYHRDGARIEASSRWTDLYTRNAGWAPQIVDFDDLPQDGFQKMVWSEAPSRIDELAPILKQDLSGRFDIVVTDPELLEFLTPGANKAEGARTLASKLGIDVADTLAFGDGNNDVELLRWAGVSVAMSHGRESARQAARFVSPPGPPESAFARAVDLALSA